jgi:hypothetical protein
VNLASWQRAADGARWYLPESKADAGSIEAERRFPVMIFLDEPEVDPDHDPGHSFRVLLVPSLEVDNDFSGPWPTLGEAMDAAEVLAAQFLSDQEFRAVIERWNVEAFEMPWKLKLAHVIRRLRGGR